LRNHVPLVSNLTFFQANRFFSVTCPKLPQGLVSRLHVGETFKVLSDFFFDDMPWKESHRNSAPDEIVDRRLLWRKNGATGWFRNDRPGFERDMMG
jgi:hypothetical protein